MTVTLPFEFGPAELRQCALEHGVIVCPMRYFCLGPGRTNQIRLSFSAVEPATIDIGIARLAAFVQSRQATHRRA
jgi:(S)-3,5-dihydroxyphenylglycine transaminase